jgi:hypothetical protein
MSFNLNHLPQKARAFFIINSFHIDAKKLSVAAGWRSLNQHAKESGEFG